MAPAGLAGTSLANPTFNLSHGQGQASGGAPARTTYSQLRFQLRTAGLNSALITVARPPQQAGRIYVESHDAVRVGAAFSNPASQDVDLSFYFTDAQGLNS